MTLPDYSSQGSRPARPAEPGTLKASLEITPAIASLTEGVVFHYYHHYIKDSRIITNIISFIRDLVIKISITLTTTIILSVS